MPSEGDARASLLVLEAGSTALALVCAWRWPHAGDRGFARMEAWLGPLAQRRRWCVLLAFLLPVVLRLAMLPLVPIPQPFVHDEFSYLLAADTFASGRLTNPTHPLWMFFESFHITQRPSYMSMYFPAQGLLLAGGKVLFGDPWFGVLASVGLMCAAMCWMFQGWLPPAWALLGSMLAVMRLGLFSNWINGYYGGAAAAAGGALVLGALPRLVRQPGTGPGLALAVGAIVLANSRPYEGLLVCAPAFLYLVWSAGPGRASLMRQMILPCALMGAAAVWMGYYNHRVFGNVFTLPYQVNRAEYAVAPVFLWQKPRPAPEYRHQVLREFYTVWELGDFRDARTAGGFAAKSVQKTATVVLFFFGVALLPALAMLPRCARDRRIRYLMVSAAIFAAGLSLNAWLFPHYTAPFAAAIYVIMIQGLRHLRVAFAAGRALIRYTVISCCVVAGLRVAAAPLSLSIPRWPAMWYGTEPLGLARASVASILGREDGPQLAIVHYAPDHPPFDDWVYNAAAIDPSKVVWARDRGLEKNRELIRYFRGRRVWLIEPDCTPPRIRPYVEPQCPPELPFPNACLPMRTQDRWPTKQKNGKAGIRTGHPIALLSRSHEPGK